MAFQPRSSTIAPLSPAANSQQGGVQAWLRRIVPYATVLLLLALSFTPLPGIKISVAPPLTLIGVAFWSARRPDRFGIVAAFSFGLLQDLITGAPPGITAFLYALLQRLALRQHHLLHSLSFLPLWSGYGAMQVAVALIQWLLWSWLTPLVDNLLPLGPFLLQACLGILLFPPVCWCLARIQATTVNAGRPA